MPSRRDFLERAAFTAAGLGLPFAPVGRATRPTGFIDLIRAPDRVTIDSTNGLIRLVLAGEHWSGNGVAVSTSPDGNALRVALTSPGAAVRRVQLRWRGSLGPVRQLVGDAWERGYGDLEWRGWVPDRVMPWYFATHDGAHTHAYGVRTGAAAFCYWQADPDGISLTLDVRSGGTALAANPRTVELCSVICRAGHAIESAFAALHAFCTAMCPAPRLPSAPVYGSNDWYWAYGKNSAASARADAAHVVELSPSGGNRPFVVIDDGWQPGRGAERAGAGTWDHGNDKFPDMAALAAEIRRLGARPGIWIRPLEAPADAPDSWRLPRDRNTLDPTVAAVRQKVSQDIRRIREWGFDLIKHDYSTFDIFGRWGNTMGSALTRDGWTFSAGPDWTSAEVIDDLYRTIRDAAGDALVIGCNTVSHLSAGRFEICRIGDDTSGTEWARTRRMGVNSLAFRGAQHRAFYVADADCVGVTTAVPWSLNKQWLDLLSRSGTMLFVSLAPDALGAEQRRDLRDALARAAVPQPLAEPLDWQRSTSPERWRMMGREWQYDWTDPDAPA